MSEGRILAVDYGAKRVGIALSDPLRIFAKPLAVLANTGFTELVTELTGLILEHGVGLVVVGLPLAIEGGNTAKTDETQAFIDRLTPLLPVPVRAWDERYSTSEAVDELIKLGYDWRQRRKIQDAMAAAMILKSFLASLTQA